MNLGQLASKARELVQRRGGTESLKQDAEEVRGIASGQGSVGDKAKAAAEALKDPGAGETEATPEQGSAPQAAEQPADAAERGRRGRGERGRRRRRRRG
jgi:hypothetical protein